MTRVELLDINPELKVEARQEGFRDADGLLVCCADSRRCEALVNAVSLAKGLPAVYVGGSALARTDPPVLSKTDPGM